MINQWGIKSAAAVLALALLTSGVAEGKAESAAAVTATATSAVPAKTTILLDDVELPFDSPPIIVKGVTFVPFRTIGEALGLQKVVWDEKTQTVTAEGSKQGKAVKLSMKLGSGTAVVNGTNVNLPAAPMMRNNRVLIPLSFFSTQFGAQVGWSQSTNTVTIKSPKKAMHLRTFYALSSFAERDLVNSANSVAYGWSRIDRDGNFTLEGTEYRVPEPSGDITPQSLVSDAANKSIKPYLMVYSLDGQNELTTMMGSETLRANSISGITKAISDYGFGGVVLDFEGLGFQMDKIEQQKLLNGYVKQLKDALPQGIALSLVVHAPNSAYQGYDYKTLASLADDLVLMAYKYNPSGTAAQVPNPNNKVNEAIQLALKAGVPKSKLLLGIDLSAETPQSIDDKLGLAKRYQLKGAALWRLGLYSKYSPDMIPAINKSVIKE
ncbi:copper amine oxidase-like protein [Paenibacillus sp. BK033]|uniref:stalk domain-containing protein n=1 Tax=Paenibacillus sp. BK033 TaxID=2512133 RepID=UPI001045B19B|nr:stalk domain-containing protein [Paenibacillus sp. BK033]TCM96153.1 copper amine oxidase-like protein [Paenibacillus sp. BK033]